jgi:hypothetical protein
MIPSREISRSGCIDIARIANLRIWEFVHLRANRNLRAGAGFYSTPFRGGLFGEMKAAEVAKQLSGRAVDVLWLGTNPCVQRSLDNIINRPSSDGDFPGFEKQIDSRFFGSCKWEPNGSPKRDFNPIERPTGNWEVYRDVLARIARLDRVAMANFFPWGSQNSKALVQKLAAANRPLLERIFEFGDDLNAEIIQALAPRLVVVPFGLGRNRRFDVVRPMDLTLARAKDAEKHTVNLSGRTFKFYTARCQRGRLDVPTVFLPHAASLRLSTKEKKRVVSEVAQTLRDFR